MTVMQFFFSVEDNNFCKYNNNHFPQHDHLKFSGGLIPEGPAVMTYLKGGTNVLVVFLTLPFPLPLSDFFLLSLLRSSAFECLAVFC